MANKNRNLMENLSEKERKKLEKKRARQAKEKAKLDKAVEAEKARQEKKLQKEDKKIQENKPDEQVTNYDRKMAEREKQKKFDRRAARTAKIVSISLAILVAAGLIWHFGSNYYYTDVKYLAVGDQKISQKKWEYYYGYAKRDFLTKTLYGDMTYGDYLKNYLSYDETAGDASQNYGQSGYTYEQSFNTLAVENIKQEMALLADMATKDDFTYDTQDSDYDDYMSALDTDAEKNGQTREEYIASIFGEDATEDSISDWLKTDLKCNAYLQWLMDNTDPTEDEIRQYYEDNKQSLDTVTYLSYTSDSGDETFDAASAQESSDVNYASISSQDLADWLFDESRQPGDTTVIENDPSSTASMTASADSAEQTVTYIYVQFESRQAPDLTTDTMKTTVRNQQIYDLLQSYEKNYELDNVRDHISVIPDNTQDSDESSGSAGSSSGTGA